MLQVSAKQSAVLKLASKLSKATHTIQKLDQNTPDEECQYVGLRKKDKVVLFQMDGHDPKYVWHKSAASDSWSKSDFLGYPIVEKYTLEEIQAKSKTLKDFIRSHWKKVSDNPSLSHGDLTHLNVLWNGSKVFLIDEKEPNDNPLADVFSMYAYLKQCFKNFESTSTSEKDRALGIIDNVFYSALRANDEGISQSWLSGLGNLHFPGLQKEHFPSALSDFEALMSA